MAICRATLKILTASARSSTNSNITSVIGLNWETNTKSYWNYQSNQNIISLTITRIGIVPEPRFTYAIYSSQTYYDNNGISHVNYIRTYSRSEIAGYATTGSLTANRIVMKTIPTMTTKNVIISRMKNNIIGFLNNETFTINNDYNDAYLGYGQFSVSINMYSLNTYGYPLLRCFKVSSTNRSRYTFTEVDLVNDYVYDRYKIGHINNRLRSMTFPINKYILFGTFILNQEQASTCNGSYTVEYANDSTYVW